MNFYRLSGVAESLKPVFIDELIEKTLPSIEDIGCMENDRISLKESLRDHHFDCHRDEEFVVCNY